MKKLITLLLVLSLVLVCFTGICAAAELTETTVSFAYGENVKLLGRAEATEWNPEGWWNVTTSTEFTDPWDTAE